MPINARPEFFRAQQKFLKAKTREEKIAALEEMLALAPSHKGAEHLRAEIRGRMAKLRLQKAAKSARKTISIPKEGDAQVCIIGLTQSGKSTFLAQLTNAKPAISSRPYTTVKPEVGVAEWKGVKLQLIEIPATFQPMFMSIAANADGIIFAIDSRSDIQKQKEILYDIIEQHRIRKPVIEILTKHAIDSEQVKEKIWSALGLIRVYTKEPGKEAETKALVLKAGATVRDAAAAIHKDFLKYFKFAKVWRTSRYPGERVGLDYKLRDGDVLEIHAG